MTGADGGGAAMALQIAARPGRGRRGLHEPSNYFSRHRDAGSDPAGAQGLALGNFPGEKRHTPCTPLLLCVRFGKARSVSVSLIFLCRFIPRRKTKSLN